MLGFKSLESSRDTSFDILIVENIYMRAICEKAIIQLNTVLRYLTAYNERPQREKIMLGHDNIFDKN